MFIPVGHKVAALTGSSRRASRGPSSTCPSQERLQTPVPIITNHALVVPAMTAAQLEEYDRLLARLEELESQAAAATAPRD